MFTNLSKPAGLIAVLWFITAVSFYTAHALTCYWCQGFEACSSTNLGKNYTNNTTHISKELPFAKRDTFGTAECFTGYKTPDEIEYCITLYKGKRVFRRGCYQMEHDPFVEQLSKQNNCPLESSANIMKRPCFCFSDLCNGDPFGCCDIPDEIMD